KEAGLRLDGAGCDGSLLMVNTDGEVVAFGGAFPFFDFRAHGAPAYQSGDTVAMRIVYAREGGVNGFRLSVGGVTSPFLPAQGGALCAGATAGGYLQVQNAPSNPANGGAAQFAGIAFEPTGDPPP